MTIQTIGIGAAPNDGTGDPLRTAFDKVNDNFSDSANAASKLVQTAPADITAGRVVTTDALSDNGGPLLTEGTVNLNVFGGLATGDVIATGYANSATSVVISMPISLVSEPASITVVSTFGIFDASSTVVTAGLVPSINALSSQKIAVLVFTGLTGLTQGEVVTVRTDDATSKITVNP